MRSVCWSRSSGAQEHLHPGFSLRKHKRGLCSRLWKSEQPDNVSAVNLMIYSIIQELRSIAATSRANRMPGARSPNHV